MRLAFPFAIALAVGLLVPGTFARQQEAPASPNGTPQTSPPPAPSKSQTEPAPAEQSPAPPTTPAPPDTNPAPETKAPEPDKKVPEPDTKGKSGSDSTGSDSATTDSTGTGSDKTDVEKTSPGKTDSERSDSAPDSRPDSTRTSSAGKDGATASSSNGATKRTQRSTTPAGSPRKIVVRKGGAKEPATQIAPGLTPAEAARVRQNAEQWLQTTGDQMQQLSILPDSSQQETVGQIRNYMLGARSALQEGDVRRASTLAEKAHLLAEDLLKR